MRSIKITSIFFQFTLLAILTQIIACGSNAHHTPKNSDEILLLPPPPPTLTKEVIDVCSFNIQFLGFYSLKDTQGMAEFLKSKNCDIVVIQELVSPPSEEFLSVNNLFPFSKWSDLPLEIQNSEENKKIRESNNNEKEPNKKGSDYIFPINTTTLEDGKLPIHDLITPRQLSTDFFTSMNIAGYDKFVLSPEDTSPTRNRVNSSASEWWVTFFKDDLIELTQPQENHTTQNFNILSIFPHGFLSSILLKNPDFDRTPFALQFQTKDQSLHFTLISVHLAPGSSSKARRKTEMDGIKKWIDTHNLSDELVITLGDMNIENCSELSNFLPENYISLNSKCLPTNTLQKLGGQKPYDHVVFNSQAKNSDRIILDSFIVDDLINEMEDRWYNVNPSASKEKCSNTELKFTPLDLCYPGGIKVKDSPFRLHYNHDQFRQTYSDHHPIRFQISLKDSR